MTARNRTYLLKPAGDQATAVSNGLVLEAFFGGAVEPSEATGPESGGGESPYGRASPERLGQLRNAFLPAM